MIASVASVDDIVTGTAKDSIVAGPRCDPIVTIVAFDDIASVEIDNRVITGAGFNSIVPTSSVDERGQVDVTGDFQRIITVAQVNVDRRGVAEVEHSPRGRNQTWPVRESFGRND